MTSPQPLPPHQDPTAHDDPLRVTMLEHVTSLIAQLDRRFDTMHEDLKESITRRFQTVQRLADQADLRYEQRFAAQKEAVDTAMIAAEKATTKAEVDANERFRSVNEFRQTLSDQTATFVPRPEAAAQFSALSEKIETGLMRVTDLITDMKERATRIENDVTAIKAGKQGGKEAVAGIYALAGFLVSLLVIGGVLAAAGVFTS